MAKENNSPLGDDSAEELNVVKMQNMAVRGASAIEAKLRWAIETGVYSHGDRLLPERELAASFKTARNTIRNALCQLEEEGLVVRRVGSGTFVNFIPKKPHTLLDLEESISPLQLIEARFAVEPYVTRLAAINATQNDLQNMDVLLNRLEACRDDKDAFTLIDGEFHEHLARCARNPLLLSFFQQINRIRTHSQWRASKEEILTPKQIDAYNAQHRSLFEALAQRNVAGAVQCIRDHLEKAKSDLVGADST